MRTIQFESNYILYRIHYNNSPPPSPHLHILNPPSFWDIYGLLMIAKFYHAIHLPNDRLRAAYLHIIHEEMLRSKSGTVNFLLEPD